tara:strand:- start:12319 stop:13299 length:981 start_codon:yes stop_codon:yes gene_type:complete
VKINLIGGGTWGITLAYLLSKKTSIFVWQRSVKKTSYFSKTREHPNLKSFSIPSNISFTSSLDSIDFNNLTILAVPSHAIFDILSQSDLKKNGKFLIASKGFDPNFSKLISEIMENSFNVNIDNIAVISGPNHAEEVIHGMASATVIASSNTNYAKELQSLFSSDNFRAYTSDDIIGVQIGGAVKNIIAIASGLCVGLKLGDNTQAALVSRGMNEILNLTTIYNLNTKTLYGLSGLGDLIATCYSPYSRNRQLGVLIGKGYSLKDAKDEVKMISEGINACKILKNISDKHNLDMPICTQVYKILFEKSDPGDSLNHLMTRNLKDEN